MKRFPSWIPALRRTVLILATLATAAAAAWLEEDVRGERELRRFAKQCADEGRPLDYAFYRPPPVADEQNLFQAPVIARVMNDLKDPLVLDLPSMGLTRIMGQWQRGKGTAFGDVFGILKRTPPAGSPADAKAAAALILEAMEKAKPELDAIGDAALERPYSQIPFRPDGYLSPTFRGLRYFTQALTLRAVAEVELGRNEDAFRDLYASLRFTEGAVLFPSHLHLMMANVMGTLDVQAFWEGWLKGAWNEAQLKRIQEVLSRLHPLRQLPAAFAAGRAYGGSHVSDLGQPWWMPEGWRKMNAVRYYTSGTAGGDLSSFDPVLETVDIAAVDRDIARAEGVEHTLSPLMWLSRNEAWSPRIAVWIGASQNTFALARTVCALERHRLARGKYPASLAGLVPAFLDSVPRDVIDGQPLRYACPDGLHFSLYSVGYNRTDDRGALPGKTDKGYASFVWASREGDWVWPQSEAR
jgi:hypothetical protein